jgi:integrase
MTGIATIDRAVEEYVLLRRALGFRLAEAPMLRNFARYLKQEGASYITTRLAVLWAKQPALVRPAHWAYRLRVVRQFARHLSPLDPRTEVPPAGLLPFRTRRPEPYLYTDAEVQQLLDAARRLPSTTGLRAATYSTLIGLFAVTGLRSSEALALDDRDVDFREGVLTIRDTKYRKSRLVPLHPSSVRALRRYQQARARVFRHRMTEAFFVGQGGRRLLQDTVEDRFRKLCRQAGVGGAADRREPRLHDFRHRLAVRALIRWYRRGADVEHHMPALSTYLGHARIADTYWYLTAVPELLRLAADRLERRGTKP